MECQPYNDDTEASRSSRLICIFYAVLCRFILKAHLAVCSRVSRRNYSLNLEGATLPGISSLPSVRNKNQASWACMSWACMLQFSLKKSLKVLSSRLLASKIRSLRQLRERLWLVWRLFRRTPVWRKCLLCEALDKTANSLPVSFVLHLGLVVWRVLAARKSLCFCGLFKCLTRGNTRRKYEDETLNLMISLSDEFWSWRWKSPGQSAVKWWSVGKRNKFTTSALIASPRRAKREFKVKEEEKKSEFIGNYREEFRFNEFNWARAAFWFRKSYDLSLLAARDAVTVKQGKGKLLAPFAPLFFLGFESFIPSRPQSSLLFSGIKSNCAIFRLEKPKTSLEEGEINSWSDHKTNELMSICSVVYILRLLVGLKPTLTDIFALHFCWFPFLLISGKQMETKRKNCVWFVDFGQANTITSPSITETSSPRVYLGR